MGKIAKDDHVGWLRKQGLAARQAAEKVEDEAKRARLLETAERMKRAADALAAATAGDDPESFGGHTGLLRRLGRGTLVHVRLLNTEGVIGVIEAMGRYDFALKTEGGNRELVIPKHAVLWWELLGEEEATEDARMPPPRPKPDTSTTEIREW